MLRAFSAPALVATLSVTASLATAQSTVRPIPSVARSWESAAVPAIAKLNRGKIFPAPAAVDLGFIGPPEFEAESKDYNLEEEQTSDVAELSLFGMGIASSDFQGNQGNVTTQRGGWDVNLGQYRSQGLSVLVELGTEASFYDFGGNASPVSGVNDPFNDAYDTHLSGRFLHRDDDKLDFYGGLQVGNSGEDAVGLDDSVYVGGAIALRYNARPDFALLAGFAGMSRFDDSPWILPYIGFDWRVNEDLRVKTEAAEIHMDYQMGESWSLGLEAVYDFRQYRLNDGGPLNGGSFRDEEIRAGATLGAQISEGIQFELQAGKVLWREVVFHDGDAGYLGETELSSPLYVGLGLKVSF